MLMSSPQQFLAFQPKNVQLSIGRAAAAEPLDVKLGLHAVLRKRVNVPELFAENGRYFAFSSAMLADCCEDSLCRISAANTH